MAILRPIGMDNDGGGGAPPKAPAAPPPPIVFDSPVVNTAPSWPVYNPAPVYQQPRYYQPATYSAPSAAPAAAAPTPPPPPPKPAPIDYTKYSDDALAGVDSAFTDQRGMYKNALDKFLLDATRQEGDIKTDATTALGGVDRNQVSGVTGLNEDFAARGLGRSGMRLNSVDEANQQYSRQRDSVRQGRDRGLADIAARREKMQSDTQNNIQAARREAYARLAAKQELA